MANYPQEFAQDAVCQSRTGHMTGLWFLSTRPLRLNTNERMIYIYIFSQHTVGHECCDTSLHQRANLTI